MKYVLVLSDVHLAPVFDSPELPFRSGAFVPDVYLSQTIDRAVVQAERDRASLEIVLNGDVFDFDVAQDAAEAASATRATDTRTELGAAHAMHRILANHPPFVLALRRAYQAGAVIVVLPGNHDAQVAFEGVKTALIEDVAYNLASNRLCFFPWYYLAAGGAVLVEHGHLYDPLCAVSQLLLTTRAEPTVGTVSAFYAPLLVPDVDPFVTDPFSERGSLRASLARAMAKGGPFVACAGELLVAGADRTLPDDVAVLAKTSPDAARADAAMVIDYRRRLVAPKATLGQLFAVCTGAVDYAALVEDRITRAMTAGTSVHNASVAVVGHTHHPGVTILPNAKLLLNSGSWTPRRTAAEPVGSFAWIEVGDDGRVRSASVKYVERGSR